MRRLAAPVMMAILVATSGCLTWAATTPRRDRTWGQFAAWGTIDLVAGTLAGISGAYADDPADYELIPYGMAGVVLVDGAAALVMITLDAITDDDE